MTNGVGVADLLHWDEAWNAGFRTGNVHWGKGLSPWYEASHLQVVLQTLADCKVCYTLERKWRVEKQISQFANPRAGNKCKSTGKLFLSNVNHHFV